MFGKRRPILVAKGGIGCGVIRTHLITIRVVLPISERNKGGDPPATSL